MATTILINKDVEVPEGKAIIICGDPCAAYNKLVRTFGPTLGWPASQAEIGEGSVVHPTVTLGPNVTIGADAGSCRAW